jgi:hypothetical protein
LVFIDQSGFYLLPSKMRTYAPVGQTPIIPAPLSRDHLSAMGGILRWSNSCCQSISHLSYQLTKAKERLRHKTSIILGRIKQTGLY